VTDIGNYDDNIKWLVAKYEANGEDLKALQRKTNTESRRADLEELARSAQTYLAAIANTIDQLDNPGVQADERNDGISAAMRLRELLDPYNDKSYRLPDEPMTTDGRPAWAGRSEQGEQNDVELYVGERHELSVDLTPQNARSLARYLYRVADALDDEYPNRPPR
jgi:hypothetical protein